MATEFYSWVVELGYKKAGPPCLAVHFTVQKGSLMADEGSPAESLSCARTITCFTLVFGH